MLQSHDHEGFYIDGEQLLEPLTTADVVASLLADAIEFDFVDRIYETVASLIHEDLDWFVPFDMDHEAGIEFEWNDFEDSIKPVSYTHLDVYKRQIVSRKGELTHRQDHPKTDRSVRRVALPSFALHAIRSRLLRSGETDPDSLLFSTRARTPHTTNNVRRLLRDVMDDAGIENVTPHRFRRTVATVVNDAQDALLASELLGHTAVSYTHLDVYKRQALSRDRRPLPDVRGPTYSGGTSKATFKCVSPSPRA